MDVSYWLDKGSVSSNRYTMENVIIMFSNSQKANEMLGIVWKGMETRPESIIRPPFKSWCNCALWFGATDSKKHVVELGPKESEWIDDQRFRMTYLRGTESLPHRRGGLSGNDRSLQSSG